MWFKVDFEGVSKSMKKTRGFEVDFRVFLKSHKKLLWFKVDFEGFSKSMKNPGVRGGYSSFPKKS